MTISIDEVREFAEYMINTRHSKRLKAQKKYKEFFDDTFPLQNVTETDYIIRTGFVAEMASGFTQQLVNPLPKVYVEPRTKQGKVTKDTESSVDRLAEAGNSWAYQLGKNSHNPFKQTFKHIAFLSGESWIYLPPKPELTQWTGETSWQEEYPDIVPIHFLIYDPMVVFADPSEFVYGEPTRVVVAYRRLVSELQVAYPDWSNPNKLARDDAVDFIFYCDKEFSYAEADKEALFRNKKKGLINGDGRRTNIANEIPFVHAYSGWGAETPDKAPDLLAYPRTAMIMGRVEEDTAMANDFRHNIHGEAYRHRTLINRSGQELGKDAFKDYHPEDPGRISELVLPPGADMDVEQSRLFEAPVFAYRQQVRSDLASAYPAPLRGMGEGTASGREADILAGHGLELYDCAIENNSNLWSRAFEKAFKMCARLPDMLPPDVNKDDVNNYKEFNVDTKKENPLNAVRKSREGHMMYKDGTIDLQTNLIEYQGKTKAEAKTIMARLLVDDVTRNHPVFRQLMGIALAKEMGVEEEFSALSQTEEVAGMNPPINYGKRGGEGRMGNIQTKTGLEMADESVTHEPRKAPTGV